MARGGVRKNAGRKPIADKKEMVYLYIKRSTIEKYGGKEKLKEKLLENVEQ